MKQEIYSNDSAYETPSSPSSFGYSISEKGEFPSPSLSSKETEHTIDQTIQNKKIQNKKRKQIHQNFLHLKHQLNLKTFMRKTQIDSLLKKCKSKAFKSIHEALKKCLKMKLPRLPQQFITNIKIDFNKYYLEQTILEIYQENKLIESFDNLIDKNLILPNKEKTLQIFLNLKLKDVIDYYINSKQYVKDYLHIYKREGEKFATLFDFISSIFIQYYIKSKGNKPKKIRKEKNFDIKSIFSRNNETQKNKIFKIEKLMKHKLLFPSTNNLNNITIYGKNNSM